jgi:hypothetical protein
MWKNSTRRTRRHLVAGALAAMVFGFPALCAADAGESRDLEIALNLANMLRSARTVIATNQALINDPSIGDKGLSGNTVLAKAVEIYKDTTGTNPRSTDPESQEGRLLRAQMAAIIEVMDENQATINRKGVDFKGFVPAVFARLVNERFQEKVGDEAEVKVTAPPRLVRNRKARPDAWETDFIKSKLMSPGWPKGQLVSAEATSRGRKAFRVLVPEYYGAGCLACHGEPKGEIDITGYPKEGGKLGDLGAAISITLFR